MGQFETASVDFNEAREIVNKIQVEIDKMIDLTTRAHKAVESATERNNMSQLSNVKGGFDMLTTKVNEMSGIPSELTRAVNSYEEVYDSEINDGASTAGMFD